MPKENDSNRLIEEIEMLCDGLIFVSESDSEVTPIVAEKVDTRSPKAYLAALGKANVRFEETEFAKFFENLTVEHDWFDDVELKQARQFRKLKEYLQKNLEEPRVFRFGVIKIDIYVVGVAPDGRLIGVKSKAVET